MDTVKSTGRLISLDVFRGITIMGMILVNNPGSWATIYPPLKHAEWHGCTPTDLVFPFFLFIVGVAITYALSRKKASGEDQKHLILGITRRAVILIFLGLFMAAFPKFDNLDTLRFPGVLQRIGIVYFITAILFLKVNTKTLTYIGAGLLIFYWFLMSFIPVPGVGYPNLEPGKNLAAWLDSILLSGHMWAVTKTWDPEGVLSTIPAIVTTILGILTGEWLRKNVEQGTKIATLFTYGFLTFLAGYVWSGWFPLNKGLWTSSYVLYTGGLAMLFLATCFWLVDVKNITWWTKPFIVYGSNAITVFFLSGLVGKSMNLITWIGADGNEISLKGYLYESLFTWWLSPINASLAWALTYVVVWLGLMWILYAKKIFIKV